MSGENEIGPVRPQWGPRGRDRMGEARPLRLGLSRLIVIAALLFAAAFVSAPWFAFRAVRSAAENQDLRALRQLVDYGALRAAMQAQVRAEPMAEVPAPKIWQDPVGAVRHALEQPIRPLPPRVDAYMTPAAIARMADGLPPLGSDAAPERRPFAKPIYWDVRRCRIAVAEPGRPERRTVFTFERRGLFDWTLVQIRVPETDGGSR